MVGAEVHECGGAPWTHRCGQFADATEIVYIWCEKHQLITKFSKVGRCDFCDTGAPDVVAQAQAAGDLFTLSLKAQRAAEWGCVPTLQRMLFEIKSLTSNLSAYKDKKTTNLDNAAVYQDHEYQRKPPTAKHCSAGIRQGRGADEYLFDSCGYEDCSQCVAGLVLVLCGVCVMISGNHLLV